MQDDGQVLPDWMTLDECCNMWGADKRHAILTAVTGDQVPLRRIKRFGDKPISAGYYRNHIIRDLRELDNKPIQQADRPRSVRTNIGAGFNWGISVTATPRQNLDPIIVQLFVPDVERALKVSAPASEPVRMRGGDMGGTQKKREGKIELYRVSAMEWLSENSDVPNQQAA